MIFYKTMKNTVSNLFSTRAKCVSLNCGNFCRTTHIQFISNIQRFSQNSLNFFSFLNMVSKISPQINLYLMHWSANKPSSIQICGLLKNWNAKFVFYVTYTILDLGSLSHNVKYCSNYFENPFSCRTLCLKIWVAKHCYNNEIPTLTKSVSNDNRKLQSNLISSCIRTSSSDPRLQYSHTKAGLTGSTIKPINGFKFSCRRPWI